MSWSEAQKGKEVVKKIVAEIDNTVVCEIPEPVGENFEKELYPVLLKSGRKTIRLKISMEDLEDVIADRNVRRKIRQRLGRILHKKVA